MTYREAVRMHKEAGLTDTLVSGAGDAIRTIGDLGALASTYLIAATVLGGAGVGWVAAKATAHGKQDEATARKGYEKERLTADLGNLTSKLRREYGASRMPREVKPARVLA